MRRAVLCALLVVLASIGTVRSQGKKTPLADIPEPVMSGANRDVPNVKWTEAFTFRDTKTWYRLVGKARDKRIYVYNALADGVLMDMGTVVKWDDVPMPVRNVVKRKDAAFEPRLIVTVGKKLGMVSSYKIDGKSNGKERTYLVAADGSKLTEPGAVAPKFKKKKK